MAKTIINNIICLLFCTIVIYEVTVGFLQIFGRVPSNNTLYKLTGTFNNPGPYGGILAIATSIIIASTIITNQSTAIKIISIISIILGITILPATRSRAAFLSLSIALYFFLKKETNFLKIIKNNKLAYFSLITVTCITCICLFFVKKESAIGRLHIWKIETRALFHKPLTGTGSGTVLGTYGLTQAEYFKEKQRQPQTIRIAGCPQYAFNEYLKMGIEYGIPAMLALIIVLILIISKLFAHHIPLAYGLIAFSIFSFFSYPIEAITEKEPSLELHRGHDLIQNGLYNEAISILGPHYLSHQKDYKYLFDLGYALHKEGRFSESNFYLSQGAKYSSDPMFHNIMGKNYEGLTEYDKAKNEYILAHYMVPSRIYPLYLLMRMENRIGRKENAIKVGEFIINMPYNPSHRNMVHLRRESILLLDSLKQTL